MTIKVLIVDDSSIVRSTLSKALSRDTSIEVVGTAPHPYEARDMILKLKPDVLTLDIEMPKMNGLDFLRKLMKYQPMPVIVVSSLARSGADLSLEALSLGAVDIMCKPGSSLKMNELGAQLVEKVHAAASVRRSHIRPACRQNQISSSSQCSPLPKRVLSGGASLKPVLIGASTGGVQVVEQILLAFPENCPPTVIVQHMPPFFTESMAKRLNSLCKVEVNEARDGDLLLPGRVLIAPGGKHTLIRKRGGKVSVEVKDGPLISNHRPSVEILFSTGADVLGKDALGVMLTGMGSDGATGLKKLHDCGAFTIAQDEQSSTVFGMPKAAIALGAIDKVLPDVKIATVILDNV